MNTNVVLTSACNPTMLLLDQTCIVLLGFASTACVRTGCGLNVPSGKSGGSSELAWELAGRDTADFEQVRRLTT